MCILSNTVSFTIIILDCVSTAESITWFSLLKKLYNKSTVPLNMEKHPKG